MISERHQELACLHAVGALSADELAEFETELEANADLRAFSDDLSQVTTALALAVPSAEPARGLKQKILRALAAPSTLRPLRSTQGGAGRWRFFKWLNR